MPGIVQDLRFAGRVLRRNPGYAASAVLPLAVGIGAATAIFTILNAVLLQPLPYREPDRLVVVRAETNTATHALLTSPEVGELRRAGLFDDIGSMNVVEGSLTDAGEMETVTAASATDTFLRALGVTPMLGRHLSLREDVSKDVVSGIIISDELWQRHYGGAPDILGKRVEVNNIPVTIVGVLPRGFRVHLDPTLAVPTRIDVWFPRDLEGPARERFEITVARLKPGVTRAQAQAALDGLAPRLVAQYPEAYADRRLALRASLLQDDLVRAVRPALLALMAGVALLLVMCCANVAHLTLARGSSRARELAVRLSLGAERRRVIQHLLIEHVLLGAMAGAAGLLLAYWSLGVLRAAAGAHLPRVDRIQLDPAVLAFNALISLAAVALVGIAPAIIASRRHPLDGLRSGGGRDDRAAGDSRLRTILIVSEVALLFVLLVAGGLVLRTVSRLQHVPLGFHPDRLIVARTEIAGRFVRDPLQREDLFRRVVETVAAIPGVERVSLGGPLPLEGSRVTQTFAIDDRPESARQAASRFVVWSGYFQTMGMPLQAGREFTDADNAEHRRVIVIDASLARTLWPGREAVGQRLWLDPRAQTAGWAEVVGVVPHVHAETLRAAGRAQIYVPYHLSPRVSMSVIARTPASAASLAPELRARIERLGGRRPVHAVLPLTSYIDEETADGRFALFVFGMLGVLGLVIGMAGFYGVLAYATSRRLHEIGVRLALGARPLAIIRVVAGHSLKATAAGILLGVLIASLLTRSLQALLFDVSPLDPWTFTAVAVLLLLIALLASVIPVSRALQVDPKRALQAD
jgi:putative ABC transport system permease protein